MPGINETDHTIEIPRFTEGLECEPFDVEAGQGLWETQLFCTV